jgi:hypothetical protein
MRENQLDVVLLDQRFDPVEQGTVFVTREVNVLRPAQRRRLFFRTVIDFVAYNGFSRSISE